MFESDVAPAVEPADNSIVRDIENEIMEKSRRSERISKNINAVHESRLTGGDRLSDLLATTAGSWGFILTFLALLGVWIAANIFLPLDKPWDPYPFILLNLVLSFLAGLQAPVILMSQNRMGARDRLRADHDYEVNVKAEMEIEQLHAKLDLLREGQWKELVEMQQKQITLLEKQIEMLQTVIDRQS